MQGSPRPGHDKQERARAREARLATARRQQLISRIFVSAAAIASFVATLYVVHSTKVLELAPRSAPPPAVVAAAKPKTTLTGATNPDRPIYKYSIVPGGVRSSAEVARAMRLDPVVKEHYATVTPATLRSETLKAPMTAHVSYRVDDKVYWTKKTLALPAGEKVLTDGKTMLRERCGNIISAEPLAPALDAEPALPDFDKPVDPFTLVAGVPAFLTSPNSTLASGAGPAGFPTGGRPGGAGSGGSGGSGDSPAFNSLPPGPPVGGPGVPPGVPPGAQPGEPTVLSVTPTPDVPTPTPPVPTPSPDVPTPTPPFTTPTPPVPTPTPPVPTPELPTPTPGFPTPTPTPSGPPIDPRDVPPGGGDPPPDIHDNALDPPTPVPEPGTWVLIATGLGIGAVRLLKKR